MILGSQYRPDIDGLRAIAVLSILFFHLRIPGFEGGFVGVDIFFVISGFLITRIIKQEIDYSGTLNFKRFYLRRFRRLFPALFATLFVTTCLAILMLSPAHLNSFGGSLVSSLASVSNFYFWIEADYFDVSARVKPLLHTWSLSIEEQFYLVWPATLYLLSKARNVRLPFYFLTGAMIISIYLNIIFSDGSVSVIKQLSPTLGYFISNGRSTIFFLLPFRVFEFALGGGLVWLNQHKPSSVIFRELLFVTGITLVLGSVFFFHEDLLFPSFYALVPCLGAVSLILTGNESRFGILLSNKLFVYLGLISYSLYLVHWPLIVFWVYMFGDFQLVSQILLLLSSIGIAIISYHYVECPFRYRKIRIAGYRLKAGCAAAILVLAAAGIHMKANYGWTWRVQSPVVFENVGDAARFHIMFYGGAGYPFYGPFNTEAPPDVLLMGDSHGRQYAEGIFREWVEPEGLNLYIASGSSFFHLPGFTRKTEGFDWDSEVRIRMGEALSYIEKSNSHPVVVISHFWLSQMKKADLLDENGMRRNVDVGVDEVMDGIKELKKRIGKSPLIVIGELPGAGRNLYDVFTRPIPPFFSDFNPENYLRSPLNKERQNFNERMKEFSKRTGEFTFLDPFDLLCDEDSCTNVDGENRLLYSDSHHLSKYGSRRVIGGFLPALQVAYSERNKNKKLVSSSR